jgi:hypothetical protein
MTKTRDRAREPKEHRSCEDRIRHPADLEKPGKNLSNRILSIGLGVLLAFAALARAQTWTPLTHQPPFGASTALLLTDGTVMVQALESSVWWRLTPDNTGSYINGTWTQLASMPTGYAPLYYASAVLPDGRVVVEGGEYNNGGAAVWTTLGALYNPATNTWTSIAPPSGWSNIGDAQSVVLSNGTFMLAYPFTTQSALLNPSTLTWTLTGTVTKADVHDEEGWTLLPNGKVLTIDTNNPSDLTHSELYDPATGNWSSAGSTLVKLPDTNADNSGSHEIGPAVLRPNGTVFAAGGTSNTAIYNTATGTWSVGPTFSGVDIADGPAALLTNGNVLVDASPGVFARGAQFFEFNGTSLIAVPGPPRAPVQSSYEGRMLVLPTGQTLFTDGSGDVEIYTASGTYQNAWRPTITSFPSTVTPGTSGYSLSGTQLNGLSQGAMYGDDAQSATNYPLVRITNNATNHVTYARTHNHSTMGVATGSAIVSTQLDVPAGIETGSSQLEVVTNGIPSNPVGIDVLCLTCGATASWISINGNDSNDCSHAAPCRTFSGALAKTASGGEIDILDSGDFGPVTINKAVVIANDGAGTVGLQASGTNGITVNAGIGDVVVLRGLDIDGLGTGLSGIKVLSAGVVRVESCTIHNFTAKGIDFEPASTTTTTSQLQVSNTIIRDNSGASSGGVLIKPGANVSALGAIENTQIRDNLFGLRVEDNSQVTARATTSAGNTNSGFIAVSNVTAVTLTLDSCVVAGNGYGIKADNPNANVRITNCTIAGNTNGIAATLGSRIFSFGGNNNADNGAPTNTVAQQ